MNVWAWRSLPASAWTRVPWVGLLVNVAVAFGQETLLRGYLLAGLQAAWGRWIALVAMPFVFGLSHLPAYVSDGMAPAAFTPAIALASAFGLLFGLIYLRAGTLWLPAALHFTWNYIEKDLFNLTAHSRNPSLVGALTTVNIRPTAVLLLEALAFVAIAIAVWLALRRLMS